jgi:RHS repeat-associated protein
MPFGEECHAGRAGYGGGSLRQRFTGKERDDETGLDYFRARYFSGTQGRFTNPGPAIIKKARLLDPQRLNLYAYVRNNPLKYVDPDGADLVLADGLKPKQREFLVKSLARLYMTKKGRRDLERADRSPFTVVVGKGNVERTEINPAKPGEYKMGGSEQVVGGNTGYESFADKKMGDKFLAAGGPPGTEVFICHNTDK